MLPAEGARRHSDHDVRHDEHDSGGDKHGLPALAKQREAHQAHQYGRRDLAYGSQEEQDVEVARRVADDLLQPIGGPAPLPDVLLHSQARHPRQGDLCTGKQAGEDYQDRCDDDERDLHDRSRPLTDPSFVPVGDEAPLEGEHLAFLIRLGVVVTEQVQDAVRA